MGKLADLQKRYSGATFLIVLINDRLREPGQEDRLERSRARAKQEKENGYDFVYLVDDDSALEKYDPAPFKIVILSEGGKYAYDSSVSGSLYTDLGGTQAWLENRFSKEQ